LTLIRVRSHAKDSISCRLWFRRRNRNLDPKHVIHQSRLPRIRCSYERYEARVKIVMRFFHLNNLPAVRWMILATVLLVACEAPGKTETALFEDAEVHYRRGDYQTALDRYESFLKSYPESPLANVANTRIRIIGREVDIMMGQPDTPRPRWVQPKK